MLKHFTSKLVYLFIAVLLVFFGFAQWFRQDPYSPVRFQIQSTIHESSNSINQIGLSPDMCNALLSDDGYLLFHGYVSLEQLDIQQGLFQTADNESGIFLEIDAKELNLLRLGIGSEERDSAELFPVRRLNYHQEFSFVVLLTSNGKVRIASDGFDFASIFSSAIPSCENFLIGSGNGNLSFVGSIQLGVSFGIGSLDISRKIDLYTKESLDNFPKQTFRVYLYSGLLMLLFLKIPLRRTRVNGS
jgi:hypothetical protein